MNKGKTLAHYRILEKIGSGGMGEVYMGEDTRLNRKVAIKFLNEEFNKESEELLRFVQEAKAASALNHPHILTVYEIGDAEGRNYIATELIDGETLRERLGSKEPIPLNTIFKILVQVSEALAAAHHAGIVHRDIKPENIMIRRDGYTKVLDFGLAKLSKPDAASVLSAKPQFKTAPGIVMGTASYMSPEQARGKAVDHRTDIFSLGVIMYELLTRRQPFTGETTHHTMVAIIEKDPPPMENVLVELEAITLRALKKNPNDRYQSTADLIADLKSLRKRLEFEAELERTTTPDGNAELPTQVYHVTSTGNREPGNTIAVLPFVNMSRNEDGDYFSDGLAEELLNVLAKIRGLRVAARTSSFSFKGKQTTIAEIGKILNVASILEGSIRVSGNRVRISVQLVTVGDGYHLWSETYDRTMDDIFAVQDDIAQSVVEELRMRLLGESIGPNASERVRSEVAVAARGRADDPEAQRLMLLGRHFLDRLTREDAEKAIGYFKQALALDPNYALCWAELGRARTIEAGRGWIPVIEGLDSGRNAAIRSLELEPDLAEGHALLGRIQSTYDLDMAGAEASLKRALELAPANSAVMDPASVLYYKLGRLDEALEIGRRVLVQDPLRASFWHNLGLTYHAAGKLTEAEESFRKTVELSPQRVVSGAMLALVLMDEGRIDDALKQAMSEPDGFWRLWSLAIIYHAAGQQNKADETLETLVAEHAAGNDYQLAEVYAMRGQNDSALDWLERAVIDRDAGVTHAKVNPRFHPLHNDARWPIIMKKIGFDR